MELLGPLTWQLVVILGLIVVLVGIQLYSDAQEIKSARRLRRIANQYVKEHNTPRISVIIELSHTAETIIPLLNHLYEHAYANLEIIIVIKHTAGKYAQPKLAYYRRKNHAQHLKLIKHTKGMTIERIISRDASGEGIISISPQDRVSGKFFDTIAIELLDEHIDVIAAQRHISVDGTLLSAVLATAQVWKYGIARFKKPTLIRRYKAGYVYRRKSLASFYKSNKSMNMTYAHYIAIKVTPAASPRTARALIPGTAIAAVVMPTMLLFAHTTVAFYIGILLISYCVMFALLQLSIKEYSIIDKVSLALFAPFSAIVFITIALSTLATTIRDASYRLIKITQQRYLLTK